jgi:GNAT superfamily N-acetyltransferase
VIQLLVGPNPLNDMPYEIDITPVGANEYPLIRTLHRTIFEPFAPEDQPVIGPALREEGIQLLGHLEGNPLGFLVALPEEGVLRIHGFGVMKEYRRQGIGGRMLEWIEKQADAKGWTVEMVVAKPSVEMEAFLRQREYHRDLTKWSRTPHPIDRSK